MSETDQHYLMPKGTAEMIVTMKGVSDGLPNQHRLDDHMIDGDIELNSANLNTVVVGKGVRNTLSISIENKFVPLQIFYVKSLKGNSFNPSSLYTHSSWPCPLAFFRWRKLWWEYHFVPLGLAKELMNYGDKRTSLEIKLKPDANELTTQSRLKAVVGENLKSINERWATSRLIAYCRYGKLFAAMALMILITIASINIFFSLMMLVIDKKKDISVLAALGAAPVLIRRIFIAEAFVISGIGAVVGLALGALLCWLQDSAGLVGMGMETAVVMDYRWKWLAPIFCWWRPSSF